LTRTPTSGTWATSDIRIHVAGTTMLFHHITIVIAVSLHFMVW
jgi:hypothetical protein